jgi:hypothetical protein
LSSFSEMNNVLVWWLWLMVIFIKPSPNFIFCKITFFAQIEASWHCNLALNLISDVSNKTVHFNYWKKTREKHVDFEVRYITFYAFFKKKA